MIVDEDVYLEHFGVKGMKWGVRREKQETQTTGNEALKKDNSSRNRKFAAGVAVVAGTVAVAAILNRRGGIKVSSLGNLSSTTRGQSFLRDRFRRAPKARVTYAHDGNAVQQNSKTLVSAGKTALKEILRRRRETRIIDIPSREIFTPKSKSFFEKNMPTFRRLLKSL